MGNAAMSVAESGCKTTVGVLDREKGAIGHWKPMEKKNNLASLAKVVAASLYQPSNVDVEEALSGYEDMDWVT